MVRKCEYETYRTRNTSKVNPIGVDIDVEKRREGGPAWHDHKLWGRAILLLAASQQMLYNAFFLMKEERT
jgi:hypothetical protein